MGRPVFTPLQLTDPTLNRVQAAVAAAFAELERREEETRSPGVLATAKDTVVINERVIDYRGVGGHDVVLPAAAVAGNSKSRAVFVMNNGTGSITVRASGKDSIDDETALGAGDSMLCTSNGRTPYGLWSTLRTQTPTVPSSSVGVGLWFSPVESALVIGGTSAAGDFTVGPCFKVTKAMRCLGVRFYWQQAPAPTARTVKVSFWDRVTGTRLETTDVSVDASGAYTFTFATPRTLTTYKTYLATVWDKSASGKVFTHTNTQEAGAGGGFPQGNVSGNCGTFHGPWIVYVSADNNTSGDNLPTATSSNHYPTELLLDDIPVA